MVCSVATLTVTTLCVDPRLLWFCSLTHRGFVLLLSFKLDGGSAAGSRIANAFPQGNKNKLWYFSPITDFSCSGIWCVNGSPCSASKPLQRLKHVYLHKHVPLFVNEPSYLCAASALVAKEAGEQCSAFEISSARNEIIVSSVNFSTESILRRTHRMLMWSGFPVCHADHQVFPPHLTSAISTG